MSVYELLSLNHAGMSVHELLSLNHELDVEHFKEGQNILVPAVSQFHDTIFGTRGNRLAAARELRR